MTSRVDVGRTIEMGDLVAARVAAGFGVFTGREVAEGRGALVGFGVSVGTVVGATGRSPPEHPAIEAITRQRARIETA